MFVGLPAPLSIAGDLLHKPRVASMSSGGKPPFKEVIWFHVLLGARVRPNTNQWGFLPWTFNQPLGQKSQIIEKGLV